MFYQLEHIGSPKHFVFQKGSNFTFPPHIHQCFELIAITEGKMNITVDDTVYTLKKGEAIIIFPNQVHSFASKRSSHILCIFSPELVKVFSRKTKNQVPQNNKFLPDKSLLYMIEKLETNTSEMFIKGALYLICDTFDEKTTYKNHNTDQKNLLYRTFAFIDKNLDGDCTLNALSKEIGYNYSYLSRYFKNAVGVSFNAYVTSCRLNQACYLLETGTSSILQCALECGFRSLRSFNRNFKERFGFPPTEYRNNINIAKAE